MGSVSGHLCSYSVCFGFVYLFAKVYGSGSITSNGTSTLLMSAKEISVLLLFITSFICKGR